MKTEDKREKAAKAQEKEQKNPGQAAKSQEKAASAPQVREEEEDENPFGGLPDRNLKGNLGCGG